MSVRRNVQYFINGSYNRSENTTDPPVRDPVVTVTDEVTNEMLAGQFEWFATQVIGTVSSVEISGDFPNTYTRTFIFTDTIVETRIIQECRLVLLYDTTDMPWFGLTSRDRDVIQSSQVRTLFTTPSPAGFSRLYTAGFQMRGFIVDDDGPEIRSEFDTAFSGLTVLHSSLTSNSANLKPNLPTEEASTLAVLVYSTNPKQGVEFTQFKFAVSSTLISGVTSTNDWKDFFERGTDGVYRSKFLMPKQPFQIDATTLFREGFVIFGSDRLDFFDQTDRELLIEFVDADDDEVVVMSMRYYIDVEGSDWSIKQKIDRDADTLTIQTSLPQQVGFPIRWTGWKSRHRERYSEFGPQSGRQTEGTEKVLYRMQPFFVDPVLAGTRLRFSMTGPHHPLASMSIHQIQDPAEGKNKKCYHIATFLHEPPYHHQRFRVESYSGEFEYSSTPQTGADARVKYTLAEENLNEYVDYFHAPERNGATGIWITDSYTDVSNGVVMLRPFRGGLGEVIFARTFVLEEPDDADNFRVTLSMVVGADYEVESQSFVFAHQYAFVDYGSPNINNADYLLNSHVGIGLSKLVPRWQTDYPPAVDFGLADVVYLNFPSRNMDTNGDGIIDQNDLATLGADELYPGFTASESLSVRIRPQF